MSEKKRIIIIGATSAIAEHCARLWIQQPSVELILVGRNKNKTQQIADDLQVRNPNATIQVLETNFIDPVAIQQLTNQIGDIDTVLIAHGSLPDQTTCQQDLIACQDALNINGISPVLFAEAFANVMEKANKGTLAIIGSVAGDRGRKSNYVYGSAKGMVTRYAQGLQHRLAKTNVKVVLIKPGPTDTPMTAHLKQQGAKLANVENVAKQIVKSINQGKLLIYTPSKWTLIMLIIRHLPNFIFKRMDI